MEPINLKMTVFFSYFDAAMDLPDDERLKFYDEVQKYSFFGIEPELSGIGKTIFKTIRPSIDKSLSAVTYGKKGGRPKTDDGKNPTLEDDETTLKTPLINAENHPLENSKTPLSDGIGKGIGIGVEKDNENEKKKECVAKRFCPPTLEEVKAYCQERNNNVDPQRFIDYYASVGWKVGKNPMKDWKAAVRTWEQKDKANVTESAKADQADTDADIMEYYKMTRNSYPLDKKPDEGLGTFRRLACGDWRLALKISEIVARMVKKSYVGEYTLQGLEKDIEAAYGYIRH